MASFFARPNLSDEQFKQLQGTTLTLSGQTRIASISGLTLATNNIGGNVIVTASGASTAGHVLTYDGAGKIRLLPSTGGGGVYLGASPTTCTVGGLSSGSPISSCTYDDILQKILVPELFPLLIPATSGISPTRTFTISGIVNPYYEVGTIIPYGTLVATSTFSRGCICKAPYSVVDDYRIGTPSRYCYRDFCNVLTGITTTSLSNLFTMPSYTVYVPNSGYVSFTNTAYGCIRYLAGTQPTGSTGSIYNYPYPSGITSGLTASINGVYPYFYGKITCTCPAGIGRPTPATVNACIIAGCGKTPGDSSGTISINFNGGSSDYLWFATPCDATTKTCWYVTGLNNWFIGGPVSAGGNLFPDYDTISPTSAIWSNVAGASPHNYKVYISNYQYGVMQQMELRNS